MRACKHKCSQITFVVCSQSRVVKVAFFCDLYIFCESDYNLTDVVKLKCVVKLVGFEMTFDYTPTTQFFCSQSLTIEIIEENSKML